jgi:hypothetical protein
MLRPLLAIIRRHSQHYIGELISLWLSKGILFLQDSAAPHKAAITRQKLADLHFEILKHPAYSPDLAPSDYYLFPMLFIKPKTYQSPRIKELLYTCCYLNIGCYCTTLKSCKSSTYHLLPRCLFASLILRPWRWGRHVPPKCRLTFNGLHGVTSQKIEIVNSLGARGSLVGWGTMLQAGRSQVRFPMGSLDFSIDVILPAAPCSWGRLSL